MRRRTEGGSALIEFVWLGILLMVPLVYVVLAVFDTQRTAYAASAAARSAGRAFLTAPDLGSAETRAHVAARLSFDDQGANDAPFEMLLNCRPTPDACLTPGSSVTVRVITRADLPLMPAFLGERAPSIRIESEHSAPYGKFREAR